MNSKLSHAQQIEQIEPHIIIDRFISYDGSPGNGDYRIMLTFCDPIAKGSFPKEKIIWSLRYVAPDGRLWTYNNWINEPEETALTGTLELLERYYESLT